MLDYNYLLSELKVLQHCNASGAARFTAVHSFEDARFIAQPIGNGRRVLTVVIVSYIYVYVFTCARGHMGYSYYLRPVKEKTTAAIQENRNI